MYAVVTANGYNPGVEPGDQELIGEFDSTDPILTANLTAGITYYVSVDNDQGGGEPELTLSFENQDSCQSREGTDSGTYVITVTPPGALLDCNIYLPPDAAVGTFTNWADFYWMPGEKLYPPLSMEPGQSLWVVGQDETGMYKKVVLSCQYLWVESAVIGPNYDETWNGTPLPTTVVE